MIYEINGTVKRVLPVQAKGGYKFQCLHLEVKEGQYADIIEFQASGSQLELINGLAANDQVTVRFVVKGREWVSPSNETKVFVTLKLIGITRQSYSKPF